MRNMKKVVYLSVLFSVLLFTACKFENVSFNSGNRIEPSSKIVKNEYTVAAFDQMDVNVIANLKFIQSKDGDYRVVLSCPDNYVDLFKFEVEDDGELEIGFKRNNVNIEARNVDITVYSPKLKKLENSGVSSIEIDRLKGDRLEVENSGLGTLYISELQFADVDVECSGVGSIEIGGQCGYAELDCSGVGSIKAEPLKSKAVKAEVSGVGGIVCTATESIRGYVSGVGSLKYGGKPQDKELKRTGVGDISEL